MSATDITVFRNGDVFRANAACIWATAVAVQGTQIVALGGDREIEPYLRGAAEVIDLDGRLLAPGFIDAHAHPIQGGLGRIRCDLAGGETIADYIDTIAGYRDSHPEQDWILGGGWNMAAFPNGTPTRGPLDAIVSDRPVVLPNRDLHSVWVNSRALAIAGIDSRTPDPSDGRIERDVDGVPTGLLHEGAMELVRSLVPATTAEDMDAGLREAQRYLHATGIVAWQDASVTTAPQGVSMHDTYLRADQHGWLTARVAGALKWDRSCGPEQVPDQVSRLVALREQARSGAGRRYEVSHVKIHQDGIAETFTAALLEPYLDRCGHATDNTGMSFLSPELLCQATIALDAAGFDVHFHTLGDRAVREVLDAVEATWGANGRSDRRHQLAHLQIVHPDDRARFRRLGVLANLQPLWAVHEAQMDELTIPFIGAERTTWQYPFGDLHRDGATLVMGSDWPVSSPDPLAGLHVAVNRKAAHAGAGTPPLDSRQSLPLGVAFASYTAGSAWANRLDGRSGSLSPGLDADLVVLDRNPFDAPVSQIASTRVHRTYVAGELVHKAD
jgi:hypothetical protein